MILYIENPKDTTRKLLELINEFGKVSGYKINAQKSLAFLYTNNKRSEREIKETFPFTTVSKRTGASRWRKSKTRRSPSSPQIHQKYIYKVELLL